MNLLFDLDGTLLDSRQRLYQLFQHLVPASALSFEEYWKWKRSKINHKMILSEHFAYTEKAIRDFETAWMGKIESAEWLKLDKPFEGVTAFLESLRQHHTLYLVTARQFEDIAIQQVSDHGWENIFSKVLVTGQKQEKSDLVRGVVNLQEADWFIGDTGKDVQTGKELGIRTAAVLTGFLSRESLLPYQPDLIADRVVDLDFQ